MKLMGRLGWLAEGISVADFAPTTQQVEVQQLLHRQVLDSRSGLDGLLQREFPAFNARLRERGVGNIIVPER
jgi:hypothetical protein